MTGVQTCALPIYKGHFDLTRGPEEYKYVGTPVAAIFGHPAETKRLIPEPILAHRLAHVAISCMQYLHSHQDPNAPPIQDHLHTWAVKSKWSPWLWRIRLRITSARRRTKNYFPEWRLHSSSQSLRQLRQVFYSTGIQSEKFYQWQHRLYMWTLDLLYRTLRKAIKSDELTRALSKSFIPPAAPLLFPRLIKRVRKAADDYLERVSRTDSFNLRIPADRSLF